MGLYSSCPSQYASSLLIHRVNSNYLTYYPHPHKKKTHQQKHGKIINNVTWRNRMWCRVIHTHTYIYTHIHTYNMCVCVCVCVCVCAYIYRFTYIISELAVSRLWLKKCQVTSLLCWLAVSPLCARPHGPSTFKIAWHKSSLVTACTLQLVP